MGRKSKRQKEAEWMAEFALRDRRRRERHERRVANGTAAKPRPDVSLRGVSVAASAA